MIKRTAALVGLGGVIVACGGGGSSGGGGGAATDATSFAEQYCDLLAGTCCPKHGKAYNKTQCVGLVALSSSQGGQYDATAGSACIGALRTALQTATTCDDYGSSNTAVQTACKDVYKTTSAGTKSPGDQCTADSDCAPQPQGDVSCTTHSTNGAETKACQVKVRAKEGDTCSGNKVGALTEYSGDTGQPTLAICWADDGLYCSGSTHKCTKRGNPGDACSDSDACVATARCDFTTETCVALTPIGGDCSGFPEGGCVTDAYCDAATKKCVATLAAGAACTQDTQCGQNASCTNQKCESADLATAFICGN